MCRLKVKCMQRELVTLLNNNVGKRYSFLTNNCFYLILDPLVKSGFYKNKDYKRLFKLCNFNKDNEIYEIMKNEFCESEFLEENCLILTKMDSIYYNHLIIKIGNCFYEITQKDKVFNKKCINIIIIKDSKFFKF